MAKRKIINIDEEKCNGCGLCIPNCPEGALQIIDDKARLISDLFCDGLGACIGHCPQGAIYIEEREAEKYDEAKVMANIVRGGKNVIKAHLDHLKGHGEAGYLKEAISYLKKAGIEAPIEDGRGKDAKLPCGCPGSNVMNFGSSENTDECCSAQPAAKSRLRTWPIQIKLVPPNAPYLNGADILVSADCAPFAYANFHEQLLKNKVLLIGCPKLDDIELYREKIREIVNNNNIKSVTYARMEVPCCAGLSGVIKDAIAASGKKVTFDEVIIGIKGERLK